MIKAIVNKNNFTVLYDAQKTAYYCFSYEKFIASYYKNDFIIMSKKLSGDNKKHLKTFKKIVDSEIKV